MPRPRKCRKVCCLPPVREFRPVGAGGDVPTVTLTVDEYEALRLIDQQGLSQEECGEYMHIARTTAQQIYACARKKLADALVGGCALKIEGGDYQLCDGAGACCGCGPCHRRHQGACQTQGGTVMKIAIPVDETKKAVCVSFGRTPYFLIHDLETGLSTCLENPAAEAQDGAGVQSAQFVLDQGAQVVITVRCGENAARLFQAAGIEIYEAKGQDAEENLSAYRSGSLSPLTHFHAGFMGLH